MKLKIKLGFILGMFILYQTSYSQSATKQVVETHLDLVLNLVGANLNYGNANSAAADYKKSLLSPQVGVSMQAGVTPHFSLVPELYFITKGGKLTANNPLTIGKTAFRFYTMELPLLARFHYQKFYANAGPSVAFNFYGTNKYEGATSDIDFGPSGFKRLEAGMQFGGGYNFRIKQKHVALDLRYNYGLTNISNTSEMYNRSFILSLHFYKPWKTNPLESKRKSA